MTTMAQPEHLGELRAAVAAGTVPHRSVKLEMRQNLMDLLRRNETLLPGIVGYEDSVIPQIANAVLSQHNFVLLGLRGQAKTRILRGLTALLDEWLPVVPGCQINDDPLAPLCRSCRTRLGFRGTVDLSKSWPPLT
jgi:magnesium chelatase subunit I